MPSLRVVLPGKGPKVYPLYKKITSIGRGEENDVSLPDPLLADKWLKIPANNAQFGSFVGLANEKKLFDKLRVHGKLTNKGATTYKGESVVAVYDPKQHTTLYVAAVGTPYPVAIVKTQQPKAGALNFDGWNKSVTLSAPKGALDLSQFGG